MNKTEKRLLVYPKIPRRLISMFLRYIYNAKKPVLIPDICFNLKFLKGRSTEINIQTKEKVTEERILQKREGQFS